MNRPTTRPRHRSAIAVDPLLRAIFDLPQTIPLPSQPNINVQPQTRGNRLALPRTSASANSSRSSPHSRTQEDDGVCSDNSILLGESISLTGDDYDACYHSPPNVSRSLQGNYVHSYSDVGPRSYNSGAPASLKVDTIFEGDDDLLSIKKRKKSSSALRSLKKLVGYKSSGKSKLSGPSRKSLAFASSFSEDDTVNSHVMGGELLVNEMHRLDEYIPRLQSKIALIRSNIQSLERNLIATRNDLSRAHEHLHSATLELEDLQRAAIEAEIGLSHLSHRQGRMPFVFSETDAVNRSTRSMSSEGMHFLTPTSSLVIDGEDSDICYTPRSTASFESLSSQTERDIIQPVLNDVDATPLTKNTMSKKNRPRSIGNISPLAYDSADTPSTAASTIVSSMSHQDEVSRESKGKVTFYKHDSFIRTHDLGMGNPEFLLSLHHSDLGPLIDALFERGLQAALDESDNWTPVRDTEKILAKMAKHNDVDGPIGPWPNAASGSDVLVWSAPCTHEGHGSEFPLVKARCLIPTTAVRVVELLLDSDRVQEYNKMSLGRTDEHCFSKGLDKHERCPNTGIQGEAKIVRSKSQPPIIRYVWFCHRQF
jgi:uncharacterized coiled-coil protein SlyX